MVRPRLVKVNSREDVMDGATYRCDNGVQLRLKKVNSFYIASAANAVNYPDPPKYERIRDDVSTWEDNIEDPNYKAAVQRADGEKVEVITNIFLGYGCEPVYPLPEDIEEIDSDTWSTELYEMTHIIVPGNDKVRLRKAAWLKFHAVNSSEDMTKLMEAIRKFSGMIPEAEVEQAQESFRPS